MGIGHVSVGLGLKRADCQINAGWLIFAALLPDFLLGWFVMAKWESYSPAPAGTDGHYLLFTFPWSHGLLADLLWAAVAGVVAFFLTKRQGAALAVAIAVLSHFLLDGIVHVKGLPLTGSGGAVLGLGLWRWLPAALSLEVVMAIAGLWLYRTVLKQYSRGTGLGMMIYVAILTLFLVMGQAGGTGVPPRAGLIASWLFVPIVIAGIALWLDRRKAAGSPA